MAISDGINGNEFAPRRDLTFDTFVVGEFNSFPKAFATAALEYLGREYNPLFIYGDVGLGKTHLLNAVGNEMLRRNPETKVIYISSQKFESQLVNAIENNRLKRFRQKYLDVDLLLIDDIQFLAGKKVAQEEFYRAFSYLSKSSKQIVVASDQPPYKIAQLETYLRSGFESGIITEVKYPSFHDRKMILRKKLATQGVQADEETLSLFSASVEDDIRRLNGMLKLAVAYAKMLSTGYITSDIADRVLGQVLGRKKRPEEAQPAEVRIPSDRYFVEHAQKGRVPADAGAGEYRRELPRSPYSFRTRTEAKRELKERLLVMRSRIREIRKVKARVYGVEMFKDSIRMFNKARDAYYSGKYEDGLEFVEDAFALYRSADTPVDQEEALRKWVLDLSQNMKGKRDSI